MPRISKAMVMVVGLCLVATVAFGGQANTGDVGEITTPNDLSPTPEGGMTILYAPSEADDAGYRAAIAAFSGGTVDYFDASAGTPSVDLLSQYDCVYTWANFAYADNVGMGDNLADYNDGGGSVVLGAFTTYTSGNFLSGRIMDAGYSPVWSPSGSNHFSSSNYAGDGTTSIHDGVTSYECTFRDFLALQGTGAQDGSYLDGEIAHSYSSDFSVVHSNGSGANQLGCTGDWALLIANACNAGGSGCSLAARVIGSDFAAGDDVKVRIKVTHMNLGSTSRSFKISILTQEGGVVAERLTPKVDMDFGVPVSRTFSVRIPQGTKSGDYNLKVSVNGMKQGHVESIRPIVIRGN